MLDSKLFMKRITYWLVLFCAAARFAVAAEATSGSVPAKPKSSDLFADVIVAKGKNVEVKRSQLDDMVVNVKSSTLAGGQQIPPDKMALLEEQVLQQLISIQLLLAKANDEDKTKGSEIS